MQERKCSTVEAARKLKMRQPHLQRAIAQGKVTAPPISKLGPVRVRLWSDKDVERARKQLKKTGRKKRRSKS